MPPNGKKQNLLSSWKEIAAYLDRDVRTCVRWEKKYGLPVHRLDRDAKSKVFADRDEIDRWLAERAAQEAMPSDKPAGSKRASWTIPVISAAAVLVVVAVAYVLLRTSPSSGPSATPYGFRIEGSVLSVTNRAGRTLWSWDAKVKGLEGEAFYKGHFQNKVQGVDYVPVWPYLLFKDVNGDGLIETLFAIKTGRHVEECVLVCLDQKGRELWRFAAGREMTFGGKPYRAEYRIFAVDVGDYLGGGAPSILVLSHQMPDWPCQVALLDGAGKLKGEYWNSGYLMDAQSQDIDGDDVEELLLSGVNNEYRKGCIVIFKGGRLGGGSPQDDAAFRSASVKAGTEAAYILIPNADLVRPLRQEGDSINTIWAHKGEGFTGVAYDSVVYFDFNARLECTRVTISNTTRNIYAALVEAGKAAGPLDEAYAKHLADGILYRHQGVWTRQPPSPAPAR